MDTALPPEKLHEGIIGVVTMLQTGAKSVET